MSVACAAKVCGRFLWERDTSNKPFEWTGCRHVVSMAIGARLPLKGSVSRITSEGAVRQCSSDGLAIVGEKASVTSVARKA
jgi:hypothetical protein